MQNIKINEAESIFETFWDNGYPYDNDKEKAYSCISNYKILTESAGKISTTGMNVCLALYPAQHSPFCIERDCCLDIQNYDTFIFFASVPANIKFKIISVIDSTESEVLNETGIGSAKEYEGPINGNSITKIRMEFENLSPNYSMVYLTWMGLCNSAARATMLAQKSPYSLDWEDFFCKTPDITPQTELYFNQEELESLRKKVKQPGFSQWMNRLREETRVALSIVPEEEIGDFVIRRDRRFVRERDMNRPDLINTMPKLAFVGIIDQNTEMLRLACRMALAVAHCRYFYESFMGVFPGSTWHHVAFTEELICKSLVKVLDWAGGLLNWRGQNLIYDAIIMKGLPRMDYVIKTEEYIRGMNQGPVFASSLVITLIALQKRHPRYSARVAEAEQELLSMWSNYVFEDGGSGEGPAYWNYTLYSIIDALYLLARYHGKKVIDYIPETVKKSGDFACAYMSEIKNTYVPVSDAHPERFFEPKVIQFLAHINAGDIWRSINNELLDTADSVATSMECIIWGERYPLISQPQIPEYIHLPITGHTTLRRVTPDLGSVGLHVINGSGSFGHSHADKGSFILEADNTSLLIDRGVCSYDNSYASMIATSELHNVLTAVSGGQHLNQKKRNNKFSGTILSSEYHNGCFSYSADVTAPWGGVFDQNIRNIYSPNAYSYVIEDLVKINSLYQVCFILNTYGEITQNGQDYLIADSDKLLTIHTKNWKPDKIDFGPCGTNGHGRPVNRLCLYKGGASDYHLITEIYLSRT